MTAHLHRRVPLAVNSISPELAVTDYADIFQGIGKLKSEGVQFHNDPAVEPTVQRAVVYHFTVECELDALEKSRNYRNANWLNPMGLACGLFTHKSRRRTMLY